MTTRQPRSRQRRIRQKQLDRAPARSTPEIEQNVDASPAAVEARRQAQSGPGATGVAHTGEGPDTPGAGAARQPGHLETASDDEDVRAAAQELAQADGPGSSGEARKREPAGVAGAAEKHGHGQGH